MAAASWADVAPATEFVGNLLPLYQVARAFSALVENREKIITKLGLEIPGETINRNYIDAALGRLIAHADEREGANEPRKWRPLEGPLVLEPPRSTLYCPVCGPEIKTLRYVGTIDVFTTVGLVEGHVCEGRCAECGYLAKPGSVDPRATTTMHVSNLITTRP
jgi:hypothetical protein